MVCLIFLLDSRLTNYELVGIDYDGNDNTRYHTYTDQNRYNHKTKSKKYLERKNYYIVVEDRVYVLIVYFVRYFEGGSKVSDGCNKQSLVRGNQSKIFGQNVFFFCRTLQ